MKWPISLLLLAVTSRVLSKSTTDKSPASGQTTKRELLEGNYGLRTTLFSKYEPPNTTPGIEYADKTFEEVHTPSAAEQIFGSRIFPITKISDLLTGQGPPFDIALTNHLYAPVSVYNTKPAKLAAIALESTTNPAEIKYGQEKPKVGVSAGYYVEEIKKKTLSRNANIRLPGILGTEFYSQESKYPQGFLRHGHFTSTPRPLHYVYKEKVNFGPFIPVSYSQKQLPPKIKPKDLGFDYESQEGSQEDKEQELLTVATTYRPDKHNGFLSETQTYHAHPDGALSYSNYIHNQALLDAQRDYQLLYKSRPQTVQNTFEPTYRQAENINHKGISQPKPANNLMAQQRIPSLQQQFYRPLNQHGAPFQKEFQLENLVGSQFPIGQHPQSYLHETQHPFSKLPAGFANQPVKTLSEALNQLMYSDDFTNTSDIFSKLVPSPEQSLQSYKNRFTAGKQRGQHSIPIPFQNTPTPKSVIYRQPTATYSGVALTIQSQVQPTPKPSLPLDQVLQSTTIRPDIISDTTSTLNEAPKSSDQHLSELQTPHPTLASILASPATLQSLSSPQPTGHYVSSTQPSEVLKHAQYTHNQAQKQHQVQIQQQQLQEIHSEIPQGNRDYSDKHLSPSTQDVHQPVQTTPQLQVTTLRPTEKTRADYEIEIATNVDHSQLPKDLRPVQTAQQTSGLVQSYEQPSQGPFTQNQTQVIGGQPSHLAPIQSFGKPATYSNIIYNHRYPFFVGQSLATVQPFIQHPQFSNLQQFVEQPHFNQPPVFPPVQYFGKYAHSIFGGF